MNSTSGSKTGRLLILSAPSGAGKTTLVNALLARLPDLQVSVSHTTRKQRPTETEGVHYYFVEEDAFQRMVAAGEFLEHALVFDHRYGTSRREVERQLASGSTVLLEIDWQGARQVRRAAPDAESVFIVPPSVGELETRLRRRGTDSEEVIQRRLADSVSDLRHWDEFDYVVVNDDLDAATAAMVDIVNGDGTACRADSAAVRQCVEDILAGQDRLQ